MNKKTYEQPGIIICKQGLSNVLTASGFANETEIDLPDDFWDEFDI